MKFRTFNDLKPTSGYKKSSLAEDLTKLKNEANNKLDK